MAYLVVLTANIKNYSCHCKWTSSGGDCARSTACVLSRSNSVLGCCLVSAHVVCWRRRITLNSVHRLFIVDKQMTGEKLLAGTWLITR